MPNNKTLSRKIIITDDGSHSLYVPELNENYHSTHGAKQEAEHIFIKDALAFASENNKRLNVLEIGFGTGLNAFLSLQYARANSLELCYHGIEKYPIIEKEYEVLNFPSSREGEQAVFLKLHQATWEQTVDIESFFKLRKIQADFKEMNLPSDYFDVVYFDAFGPNVQADLWSTEIFKTIYKSMKIGGVMTTYSVKGDVRRAMKSVGFEVKKIPGPLGKREITRAIKAVF